MYTAPNQLVVRTRVPSDTVADPSACRSTATQDRNFRCLSSAPRITSANSPSLLSRACNTGKRPANSCERDLSVSNDDTGQPSGDVRSPSGFTSTLRKAIIRDTANGRFSRKPSNTFANNATLDVSPTSAAGGSSVKVSRSEEQKRELQSQ